MSSCGCLPWDLISDFFVCPCHLQRAPFNSLHATPSTLADVRTIETVYLWIKLYQWFILGTTFDPRSSTCPTRTRGFAHSIHLFYTRTLVMLLLLFLLFGRRSKEQWASISLAEVNSTQVLPRTISSVVFQCVMICDFISRVRVATFFRACCVNG